jgi:hypothetical protein
VRASGLAFIQVVSEWSYYDCRLSEEAAEIAPGEPAFE